MLIADIMKTIVVSIPSNMSLASQQNHGQTQHPAIAGH
jgi:hypothetical protein